MDFSSMSGWDFERYCADCLLKKGFTKAEVTSGSGDHGVDIIAEQNGIRFGIQCKLEVEEIITTCMDGFLMKRNEVM